MDKAEKKPDPEEMLFTLDQLEQTTEIMAKVVARLKRQLQLMQQTEPAEASMVKTKSGTRPASDAKQRRTLH